MFVEASGTNLLPTASRSSRSPLSLSPSKDAMDPNKEVSKAKTASKIARRKVVRKVARGNQSQNGNSLHLKRATVPLRRSKTRLTIGASTTRNGSPTLHPNARALAPTANVTATRMTTRRRIKGISSASRRTSNFNSARLSTPLLKPRMMKKTMNDARRHQVGGSK